jgi:hypothetical protein
MVIPLIELPAPIPFPGAKKAIVIPFPSLWKKRFSLLKEELIPRTLRQVTGMSRRKWVEGEAAPMVLRPIGHQLVLGHHTGKYMSP